jgi:hypothetical protein
VCVCVCVCTYVSMYVWIYCSLFVDAQRMHQTILVMLILLKYAIVLSKLLSYLPSACTSSTLVGALTKLGSPAQGSSISAFFKQKTINNTIHCYIMHIVRMSSSIAVFRCVCIFPLLQNILLFLRDFFPQSCRFLGCGMHQFSDLRFRNTYLLSINSKFIFRALK